MSIERAWHHGIDIESYWHGIWDWELLAWHLRGMALRGMASETERQVWCWHLELAWHQPSSHRHWSLAPNVWFRWCDGVYYSYETLRVSNRNISITLMMRCCSDVMLRVCVSDDEWERCVCVWVLMMWCHEVMFIHDVWRVSHVIWCWLAVVR